MEGTSTCGWVVLDCGAGEAGPSLGAQAAVQYAEGVRWGRSFSVELTSAAKPQSDQ